ncbi:MAG: cytochrome c3 family protein [Candidatus Methanoperedens sp.]|nr:cytochrome c3 family protein [Candidatus Methanoperedens sp.]MCE8425283.1 cytochrome c3 family protein [Candidatus Methanoperedens sp.]MCE8427804.1 cytochrome c3 family protein [Candidatus Methanoperedens sp.]
MDKIPLTTFIKNWISRYKLPIAIVLVVMLVAAAVITEKVLEITENPAFCGKNCHIMRPYYDSWRTSSHNDVRCVECHYEPGLIGHIKGKMNGLMQFYSYETTVEEYNGQLYAKVMDKNCLLCHEKRIFSSDVGYMGINFSHSNHLLQPKRGISITCTTCHSMLVIGMQDHRSVTDPSCAQCHPSIVQQDVGHLVVTTSSCFTCHFRDVPGNNSISGCPSCHGPPKEMNKNYTNFNHTTHLQRGSDCMTCHINISTNANDIVPKNKCYSCHNIKERVDKYDDFKFVHTNHVTNNKIACYQCHSNVKHEPKIKENLCANCHGQEHPKDWLTTHKKEVMIGKVCSDCHQTKFCIDCHASVVAGGKKLQ